MIKDSLTFLLYCLSVTALSAQVKGGAQLRVLQATGAETLLRLSLSAINQVEVQTPRGPAVIPNIQGGTPLLEKGAPNVPKYATVLQIPGSGKMCVEIVNTEYDDYFDIEIAPSKGNLQRRTDPETVPFEYGAAYRKDAYFPGALAALQTPFIFRETRGQALWIFPVQYNPVQKIMRVYRSLTLRVKPGEGPGQNEQHGGSVPAESRAFRQFYQKLYVNAGSAVDERGGTQKPEQMLVVVADPLLTELEPLIRWKRQLGIRTTVVPVSQIGSSKAPVIYNFIKDFYTIHRISYLLLAGDEFAIEPEMREDGESYACDNCFGYLEGDDHYPEVLVGRLHASTPEQLRLMVNRNLEYEKYPLADPNQNWYATGLAVCSNEGAGTGDDMQADWQQGNEWKTAHLSDGFETYWEFYDGSHGKDSPTPDDPSADQTGNPAGTSIINLLNGSGASLFNYTGHGLEQALVSGNFTSDAVHQLHNAHRYPILIAVACSAGNFTGGECLGEAWQRAGDASTGTPYGGIAGFFSSDYQTWNPPMEGQDGMNQYLLDADGVQLSPTLSGMLAYGNAKMMAAYGSNGETMADFWNPFAEPGTVPRTRFPKPLTASHPDNIPFETTSLSVFCPVEGALVSLYWQNQTWAVATVENGEAALEFAPLNGVGPLVLTISQFNYLPYQGAIEVLPSTQPALAATHIDIDDSVSGNNNSRADYGENILLQIQLKNVGPGLLTGIHVNLNTTDPYVTIAAGQLTPGSLTESDSTVVSFPLTIAKKIQNGRQIQFSCSYGSDNTPNTTITTYLTLHAPVIETGNWSIDDSGTGNGNKHLESGEIAQFRMVNRNTGSSDSPIATGILSTDSPWLGPGAAVVLDSLKAAGANNPEAVFQLSIAPNTPRSSYARLYYTVVAGDYSAETELPVFVLNPIIEQFETADFYSYAWQMSGNKPWMITPSNPYSGKYCSRSGVITHLQKSVMELNLLVSDDGFIAFARRVSSEAHADFLRFYMDDAELGSWSGEVPWGEVSFAVPAGQHRFRWVYEKDDLVSSGSDRAWIDEVILPPHHIAVQTTVPDWNRLSAKVSPNPTDGPLTLFVHTPEEDIEYIRVFDQLGSLVQNVLPHGQIPPGDHAFSIDPGTLAPGIYLMQIQGKKSRVTLKIVRLRT